MSSLKYMNIPSSPTMSNLLLSLSNNNNNTSPLSPIRGDKLMSSSNNPSPASSRTKTDILVVSLSSTINTPSSTSEPMSDDTPVLVNYWDCDKCEKWCPETAEQMGYSPQLIHAYNMNTIRGKNRLERLVYNCPACETKYLTKYNVILGGLKPTSTLESLQVDGQGIDINIPKTHNRIPKKKQINSTTHIHSHHSPVVKDNRISV